MDFDKLIAIITSIFGVMDRINISKTDLISLLKIFQHYNYSYEVVELCLNSLKKQLLPEDLLKVIKIFHENEIKYDEIIFQNSLKLMQYGMSPKKLHNLLIFLNELQTFKKEYKGLTKLPIFIEESDKLASIIFDPDLLPEFQDICYCAIPENLDFDDSYVYPKSSIETIYGKNFNLIGDRNETCHYCEPHKTKISFYYFQNIFKIYYIYDGENILDVNPKDIKIKIDINCTQLNKLILNYTRFKLGMEHNFNTTIKTYPNIGFKYFPIYAYIEKNKNKFNINGDLYLSDSWELNNKEVKYYLDENNKIRFKLENKNDIFKNEYYWKYLLTHHNDIWFGPYKRRDEFYNVIHNHCSKAKGYMRLLASADGLYLDNFN